jgi:uncharacterized repeat protein (TIGR04052 family)
MLRACRRRRALLWLDESLRPHYIQAVRCTFNTLCVSGLCILLACGSGGGGPTSQAEAGLDATTSTADAGVDATASPDATTGGDGSSQTKTTIRFRAMVGNEPFSCAASYTVGTPPVQVNPLDFRMYVSNLVLGNVAAAFAVSEWQTQSTALLDFEDKMGTCSNGTTQVHTELTLGTGWDGGTLAFDVGVPVAENHQDAAKAPSPLNLSTMFWSWQGGYKFLRADARVTEPGGPAFLVHIGSTNCNGSGASTTCGRPNRARIQLPAFDPKTSVIVVDYAALVAGNSLANDAGGETGCMSGVADPECKRVFASLGLDLATGLASAAAQTVFRVEPR